MKFYKVVKSVDMKKKYVLTGFLFSLFLLYPLNAQRIGISIEHFGFGKTLQEARFSIYNVGETVISNVTIFVDGIEKKTIEGLTSPGNGFATTLYNLDPGSHLIEIKTPEGASDSVDIDIPSVGETPTTTILEKSSDNQNNIIWVVVISLIVIAVIIIWLLTNRKYLEFS
jgi:hypothetical protein